MSAAFDKLRSKLAELFQLDAAAELDFGIYRILNARRVEVEAFLDSLQPQVDAILSQALQSGTTELKAELEKVESGLRAGGFEEAMIATAPKVKELKEKIATAGGDPTALTHDIFSHLTTFFSRYYKDGDFLSLRRYKRDTYAIPYEGEEVKLHWANADQYYIKSAENFRDYTFKLNPAADAPRVTFKLVEADTQKDNTKATAGQERRFVYQDVIELGEENHLTLGFAYLPLGKEKKQGDLNKQAIEAILKDAAKGPFVALASPDMSYTGKKKEGRTLLEKHLTDYTARNTFDYFIHKDLGGFLRRELDFYIKNEVLHLDDLDEAPETNWRETRARLKALRTLADKVIRFLAQIEDFQKKLWLKKKFVTACDYVVTLDRIPEEFYPEISACEAQREEWVRLFAIDEIEADLGGTGYSVPLTVEFLKDNKGLPVDTSHFGYASPIRYCVLTIDGIAVNSENSGALRLARPSLRDDVRFCYIDPPYNTGSDGFMYRDNFQHSSWMSMLSQGLSESVPLLNEKGGWAINVNDIEDWRLRGLADNVIGSNNYVTTVVTKCSTVSSFRTVNLGPVDITDRILLWARDKAVFTYSPIWIAKGEIDIAHFSRYVENPKDEPALWRFGSLKVKALQRLGFYCEESREGMRQAKQKWGEAAEIIVEQKTREVALELAEWVFEPKTLQKPSPWLCDHIESSRTHPGVVMKVERDKASPIYLYGGRQLYFLGSSLKTIDSKPTVCEPASTLWLDIETNNLKHEGAVDFAYGKKPLKLVSRFVQMANETDGNYFLDFFAGSGTTGHAVININREDGGNRKYILIEMGEHFNTVLVPRLKKVIYSKDWKDRKPQSRKTGVSHSFKILRLESYEDTLNNLRLHRTREQELALESMTAEAREEYQLGYMLDLEATGSQSLLNASAFTDPFSYTLNIATGTAGETKPVTVDLVETFNWLLGLTVLSQGSGHGVTWVEATNPEDEKILVLWRNIREVDADALNSWCKKQKISVLDGEFSLIYINGDHHLDNLRRDDQTWKVRLIDETFPKLMWEGCE